MKISTAFTQRRVAKGHCIREGTSRPCQFCYKRGSACSFDDLSEANQRVVNLSKGALRSLVADYFYYIHDKPHSLFLSSVLDEAVEDNTLPQSITYGIAALSAGYVSLFFRGLLLMRRGAYICLTWQSCI